MLVASFFIWWYGRGWQQVARDIRPRLSAVAYAFSVTQLLKTLFAPWRRIITYPGSSLGERLKAWSDNMFSRAVGSVVRTIVLIAALVVLAIVGALSLLELVLWPLLPPAIPILIILGAV